MSELESAGADSQAGAATDPQAVSAVPCGVLNPGERLERGNAIRSCDGRFELRLKLDGNLVLLSFGVQLWETRTWNRDGKVLLMKQDGNLVLLSGDNKELWWTRTWWHAGARLSIQDDGDLVVRQGTKALWSSDTGGIPPKPTACGVIQPGHGLAPGESVESCDRADDRHALVMQADGDLVLTRSGVGTLWAARSAGTPYRWLRMQDNGDLVVDYRSANGQIVTAWSTGTAGHPGAELQLWRDGNVEVNDGGVSLWKTGAGGGLIRYIFVLVKENHTFDSLFAPYKGANGSLKAKWSDGTVRDRPRAEPGPLPSDLQHEHASAVTGWAQGGMDGFDLLYHHDRNGVDPKWKTSPFIYYDRELLPSYYQYADEFVLADNFFATTAGPSFPGYLGLTAAQSPAYDDPWSGGWECEGSQSTPSETRCAFSTQPACYRIPDIASSLPQGFTWHEYGGRQFHAFPQVEDWASHTSGDDKHVEENLAADLAEAARTGHPFTNVVYLWGGNCSEHPAQNICLGERDSVHLVNEVMSYPEIWKKSVFLITYDDFGGFYDHVAPPEDEVCDNPISGRRELFHPGLRVPLLIISPYAKKGYVLKSRGEHASIPRLIEDFLGMPRLADKNPNARDARVGDLMDAFDFTQEPRQPVRLEEQNCPNVKSVVDCR